MEEKVMMSSATDDSKDTLLISLKEACKIIGIGRNTMLKLVKMKGFPAIILPKKILIDKAGLSSWISRNYGRYEN